MRFFRVVAMTVLLLACVVLGSGCAGARGEQGLKGDTGAQGPQGTPGIGVEWVGEWDNSVGYAKYDAVECQGSSYVSRQENNTNHLPTDTNWWDLMVEKGDTGSTGAPGTAGADGQHGAPGPNMIVAMGLIDNDGTVIQGYNITSCEWDAPGQNYHIALTGISYHWDYYVTMVTAISSTGMHASFGYDMQSFALVVTIYDNTNNMTQGPFSFMVLDTTP